MTSARISKLYDRAALWQIKAEKASLKGDYDRAGRNRTKAFQLMAKARELEKGEKA